MRENQKSLFKDDFTIRQYAAFTLAANSAYSRLEEKKIDSVKHYVDLKRECFDENQSDFENVIRKTLKLIRNYFSHYVHDVHEFDELMNEEIWLKLVQIASRRIISKDNKKFGRDEDEGEIKKILSNALSRPETLFDTNQRQPFLALILSPFLNRSELHLLIGKIRFPDPKKEDATKVNASKANAQKHVLRELAIPDSAIHILHDSDKTFLTPKQEQGFAILNYLEREVGEIKKGETVANFTDGEWFMRQLLIFLENENAVKGIVFAHSGIEEVKVSNRMTTRTFVGEIQVAPDEHKKLPYRIRHNTIEIRKKEDDKQIGVLGINVLKYLVLAVLNTKKINCFLLDKAFPELVTASEPKKLPDEASLKEKIENRIKFLSERLEEHPKKLQPQIRFISDIVNKTCQKHNKALNADEYKNLENLVRYFRKDRFNEECKRLNILDASPAQCKAERFSDFLNDDDLESVYGRIRSAHLDWLNEQFRTLGDKSIEDLEVLARELKVRGIPAHTRPEKFHPFPRPTGLTVKEVREAFFNEETPGDKKNRGFFNLVKEASSGRVLEESAFGISSNKEKYKSLDIARYEKKRRLENLARASLLRNMAIHSLGESLTREKKIKISDKQKFNSDDIEISIRVGQNHTVVCKFKKGWRDYARYSTNTLSSILQAYAPDATKINLLMSGQSDESKSVQGIIKQIQMERFTAMRALLRWEKGVVDKYNLTPDESKKYVKFAQVIQVINAENLRDEDRDPLKEYRDNVMHNNIGKEPFSEVPKVLKDDWDAILDQDEKRRKSGSSKAKNRPQKRR